MNEITEVIKEKGHRLTKSRSAILEILTSKCSITIEDLSRELSSSGLSINLSTIYRNLLALKKLGIITSRITTLGETAYSLVSDKNHHHHLTCISCHKSISIRLNSEKIIDEQFRKYNFQPVQHILELEGYCQKCNNS